jgi:hypothetical protein
MRSLHSVLTWRSGLRALSIVGVFTLALGCNKLFKHGSDGGESAEASSTANTSSNGGATTTNAATPEQTAQPTKPPTSGCAWPEQGDHDITITKGCTVEAKNELVLTDGATMTIEEGVKISFDTDKYLWVDYGKLLVKGTSAAPVTFTSANKSPGPGDWVGIGFREKTMAGTSIDHLIIEYAGSQSAGGQGSIHLESMRQGGRIAITDSIVRNGDQFGLVTEDNGSFEKFENNTFKDNKSGSARVGAQGLGSFGRGNHFNQPVHVRESEVHQTTTWPVLDVPVIMDGNIRVKSDSSVPTLTIADKTTVKIAPDIYFSIGDGAAGALVAKNVTFTSASPAPSPGDWATIFLRRKTNGTDIENCTFEYFGSSGGGAGGAITVWGTSAKDLTGVTIKNNTFKNGKQQAMHSDDGKCAPFDGQNKVEGIPFCNKP